MSGPSGHRQKGTLMAQTIAKANYRWRVIDIVVTAIIAVVSGVIFAGWDLIYKIPSTALDLLFSGASSLVTGMWLFAGPLAALIVRKPGAAIFAELVAACLEFLAGGGSIFGISGSIVIGLIQGVFAEIGFAVFAYRKWNLGVTILAGALSGLGNWVYTFSPVGDHVGIGYFSGYGLIYIVCVLISGALIAGLLMWFVYKALAATGVLDRFASGRGQARV